MFETNKSPDAHCGRFIAVNNRIGRSTFNTEHVYQLESAMIEESCTEGRSVLVCLYSYVCMFYKPNLGERWEFV